MRTRVKPAVLSCPWSDEPWGVKNYSSSEFLAASHWTKVKTGSLKKVPSYICVVSRRSCFFPHPSFLCIAVAIRLERLWIVFSIPRQLERVTGCLAIGPAGETQMVQFSCHPVCLAETSRSKWRRIYSHTEHRQYIHTHTDAHTNRIQCLHSHACMCGELSHTFFPFTLQAFTWHSCPETLEQSAAAE